MKNVVSQNECTLVWSFIYWQLYWQYLHIPVWIYDELEFKCLIIECLNIFESVTVCYQENHVSFYYAQIHSGAFYCLHCTVNIYTTFLMVRKLCNILLVYLHVHTGTTSDSGPAVSLLK